MKALKFAATVIIVGGITTLLVAGKPLLIPFFLAIVVWYLINANYELLTQLPFGKRIPKNLGLGLSAILIIGILYLVVILLIETVNTMVEAVPTYRVNIQLQIESLQQQFGITSLPQYDSFSKELDLGNLARNLLNSVRGLVQGLFLVILFVVFLLLEQTAFPKKIAALRLSQERKDQLQVIFREINSAARSYIAVKTFVSFLTAFFSYILLWFVGVDFALFWAFLLFILNYIPTAGSIIATIFPAFLALVQFEGFNSFLIVAIGITIIQVAIGSFLEPRIMGDSLNISPLVVVISLVLWGLLWGIVGMLLCVPITIILIIIFAQFPSTRPVAVFLSKNGEIGN